MTQALNPFRVLFSPHQHERARCVVLCCVCAKCSKIIAKPSSLGSLFPLISMSMFAARFVPSFDPDDPASLEHLPDITFWTVCIKKE